MEPALRLSPGEVRCPRCRAGFLAPAAPGAPEVLCGACAATYPTRDGVIDLLPTVTTARSLAQLAMEAEPIVRIYESSLWRRGPHVALALGISFAREQQLILAAADLRGGERVLDLACGPGIYSRPFARQVPHGAVVGLDLSLPMLRYANRRARAEGIRNLVLVHGTALDLPFAPAHFDVVNCCGALHLFPDAPQALAEIQRVLKPGGRFTVAAFRRSGGPIASWRAAMRRRLYGIDAFSKADLTARLEAAGLGDVRCHHARGLWLIMSARREG